MKPKRFLLPLLVLLSLVSKGIAADVKVDTSIECKSCDGKTEAWGMKNLPRFLKKPSGKKIVQMVCINEPKKQRVHRVFIFLNEKNYEYEMAIVACDAVEPKIEFLYMANWKSEYIRMEVYPEGDAVYFGPSGSDDGYRIWNNGKRFVANYLGGS